MVYFTYILYVKPEFSLETVTEVTPFQSRLAGLKDVMHLPRITHQAWPYHSKR